MVKNIPPKLYKFQALDKEGHSIQNLKRNQLWFPKPAELNDPFDLEIPFVLDWTDEDFEKFYEVNLDKRNIQSQSQATAIKETFFVNGKPKQSWKDHIYEIFENQMRQRINNEISKLGVACFTEDNLDNILMWSHYANGHKGFCLEFDTNYAPFLDTEQLRRVIYSEKYPSLPFSYYLKDESEGIPDDILRTKSLNWKYENEWRLILDVGGKPFEYDPKALTAIYFGCSMLSEDCGKIAKILAKASTRLYKMQRSYKDYSLMPIPYSK